MEDENVNLRNTKTTFNHFKKTTKNVSGHDNEKNENEYNISTHLLDKPNESITTFI